MSDTGGLSVLDRLGPRALARPAPRASIALAAAGCALVVLGSLLVGGDGLGDDGGSRWPGLVLSALVVVAGHLLLRQQLAGGPLATAGTVAAALAVPPLLFFLTFDGDDFPPYSSEAILFVSTAAWAASYLAGPGRGRPFFLGAAAIGLWMAILQATEDLFDTPFNFLGLAAESAGASAGLGDEPTGFGFGFDAPDPSTIGGLSLAFGAAYLLAARALDRRGRAGVATPLTFAGLVVLPVAVVFLADEVEAVGAGLLGMAIGTVVALHGASVARRGTTWWGAAGAAAGLLAVVGDLVDEPTPGGLALMVAGGAAVVASEALRRASAEPPEVSDLGPQ